MGAAAGGRPTNRVPPAPLPPPPQVPGGSAIKPFTASAAMLLAERGLLDLDRCRHPHRACEHTSRCFGRTVLLPVLWHRPARQFKTLPWAEQRKCVSADHHRPTCHRKQQIFVISNRRNWHTCADIWFGGVSSTVPESPLSGEQRRPYSHRPSRVASALPAAGRYTSTSTRGSRRRTPPRRPCCSSGRARRAS